MRKVRRLSTIEASMAYVHRLFNGATQVSTLLTLEGEVSRSRINKALDQWVALYPLLHMVIRDVNDELWFYQFEGLPETSGVREFGTSGCSPQELLWQEVNTPLCAERALWRVRVVDAGEQRWHLVVTRHHAISDAFTSNRQLNDLVCLLGEPALAVGRVPEPISEGSDSFGGATEATPPSPTGAAARVCVPHMGCVAPGERTTGIEEASLGLATTETVRRYCRQQGLTVNALFSALVAKHFCAQMRLGGVDFHTAVSLRNRLLPGQVIKQAGCFIAVQELYLRCRGMTTEEIASQYQVELDHRLQHIQRLLPPHTAIEQKVSQLLVQENFLGIGITNMGVLDSVIDHAGLKVVRFQTVVNRNAGNAALVLHLSTFRQQLNMQFTYPETLMEQSTVRSVCDSMVRELEALVLEQRVPAPSIE